jgi:hypothetical protein
LAGGWVAGEEGVTIFATTECFDVIGFFAFALNLRELAEKLARARFEHRFVRLDRYGYGIFPCRRALGCVLGLIFRDCPDDGLVAVGPVRCAVYTIAVFRKYAVVPRWLGFFRYWEADNVFWGSR